MKSPKFWNKKSVLSYIFYPLSCLYILIFNLRKICAKPYKSSIPIICIGNATVGGAGKTPVAIAIAKELLKNKKVAFLSKGYKGEIKNPTKVDGHSARHVGDEALLLNEIADTFIANSRKKGVQYIESIGGYDVIIMDDGYQNPTIHKDFNVLVVDGKYKFGNGFQLPAGPLRENPKSAISRADIILSLNGNIDIAKKYHKINVNIVNKKDFRGKRVIAFAGIARPEKFFNSLTEIGVNVVKSFPFSDHHYYSDKEIGEIIKLAKNNDLDILTTKKDWVKISDKYKREINVINIEVDLSDVDLSIFN